MGKKRINKTKFSRKNLEKVPNTPGVYEIINNKGQTLYVGKTNNLRNRLYDHLGDFRGGNFFRARFMPPKAAEKVENKIIREKNPRYNERQW